MAGNIDPQVVRDFGVQWQQFDQSAVSLEELTATFNSYFAVFPWEELAAHAKGFDLGCGTGRWAKLVAPRVSELHCIDASAAALEIAKKNLSDHTNCRFHHASVDDLPLEDGSMDFGYSLGVLHHIPDTERGVEACAAKLKRGAPFLLYLYYAFDNRPKWFAAIWRMADFARRILSRAPYRIKYGASQLIAMLVYLPLARLSLVLEASGLNVRNIPLSSYKNKSFYTMRTDALDRFGTRLERRFTRRQIAQMMQRAGLINIRFCDQAPYWCAIGYKA
jgi:SAM-dependent methyltransferase